MMQYSSQAINSLSPIVKILKEKNFSLKSDKVKSIVGEHKYNIVEAMVPLIESMQSNPNLADVFRLFAYTMDTKRG